MSLHGEMARPEHQIMHKRIPEGHGHLDQKYGKGMRSPILSQFPEGQDMGGSNPGLSDE